MNRAEGAKRWQDKIYQKFHKVIDTSSQKHNLGEIKQLRFKAILFGQKILPQQFNKDIIILANIHNQVYRKVHLIKQ